MAVVKNHQLGF